MCLLGMQHVYQQSAFGELTHKCCVHDYLVGLPHDWLTIYDTHCRIMKEQLRMHDKALSAREEYREAMLKVSMTHLKTHIIIIVIIVYSYYLIRRLQSRRLQSHF